MNSIKSKLNSIFQEASCLLKLSIPIMIAQLSLAGMGFVDTAMSGRVSAQDLAAIAIGSSLWVPSFLIVRGLMMAIAPVIAHLYGANNIQKMTKEVQQGLWIGLTFSLFAVIFLQNADYILRFMSVDPAIIPITEGYLNALSYCAPAVAIFFCLSCYCEGTADTRPIMIISLVGLLSNIPVNYILIYGKLGIEPMGAVGCGWATAFSFSIMTVMLSLYVTRDYKHYKAQLLKNFSMPDLKHISHLFRLGLPISIALFVEGSIFSIIALLIGKLGASIVAGHQIALSFSSITFMIPMSVSFALTVRIGQALGSGNFLLATFRARIGYLVIILCAFINISIMLFIPQTIAKFYTHDIKVIEIAMSLFIYAAAFQLSDALQACGAGILRGFKDTTRPMLIVLFAYWGIALPLGYTLGMTDSLTHNLGAQGFWIGLLVGLTVAAVGLGLRFHFVKKTTLARLKNA